MNCIHTTRALAIVAALAAGCDRPAADRAGEPAKPAPGAPPAARSDSDHGHHHEAPHGGVLVALGDHAANVEFVLQADEGKLTAYVFDGCAEKPIRIGQSEIRIELTGEHAAAGVLELKPVANALTGETAGDSSEFALTVSALKGAKRLSGRIASITVRGVEFRDVPFVLEIPAP